MKAASVDPSAESQGWVAMSPNWTDAMRRAINSCTGTQPNLHGFRRGAGGKFTSLMSADGKTAYVFSGLQVHNSDHRQARDEEMARYSKSFMTTPFESPDGKYSGFIGRRL
ncbi:MAG: hypothetical protein ABIH92_02745 [Nanoarchaeota archaeon]